MIDLHMHSRYSEDGEYTPTELVELCAEKGICAMSVTDHNCAKANEEAQKAAEEKGILYIPGIEIDCTCQGINLHVLGYGIDFRSNDFQEIETYIDDQNLQASLSRLAKTQELGFGSITEKDLWTLSKDQYWQTSWPGELFAELLLSKPEYAAHPLLQPYRPGGERSDNPYVNFYWDYYSQGKPCYVKMDYPPLEEIVAVIHRNHGAAVIAHPGVNLKENTSLLETILGLGLDGIEAFSSYHSPGQTEYFRKAARKHSLWITCGSDFHGKAKPSVSLGQHACPISDAETVSKIKFPPQASGRL